MVGYQPSSFFCVFMTEQACLFLTDKLYKLVSKGFITWNKNVIFQQDTEGNPERARQRHLVQSGIQSQVILQAIQASRKLRKLYLSCCLRFRDNLLELRIYYESLTFSDVRQVPSYDLYSLLGKQHIPLSPHRAVKLTHLQYQKLKKQILVEHSCPLIKRQTLQYSPVMTTFLHVLTSPCSSHDKRSKCTFSL